jgi:exonuclease III
LCILLAGDIASNPGPAPPSKQLPIKCATINARSLKNIHKDVTTNSIIRNLQRFQDFVYGENLDVVCVNETWLNENISNSEILNSDYNIFRKDRVGRNGGGVLVAIKSSSFSSVKEFVSNPNDIK